MLLAKEKIKEVILVIILATLFIFTIEPATYFIQDMIAKGREFVANFETIFFREYHPNEVFIIQLSFAVCFDYILINNCSQILKTFPPQKKDILNYKIRLPKNFKYL